MGLIVVTIKLFSLVLQLGKNIGQNIAGVA